MTVGDDAWTAAGSVVTADVPPGALAVARSRQRNVEHYAASAVRGRKQPVDGEGTAAEAEVDFTAMSTTEAEPVITSLPIEYDKHLMLFSGRATPDLAAKIAGKLGVELGPSTLKTFSNGEVYCRYDESIRGADVFIVQSTCGNPETGLSANDALMELLVMIDAAVGASAHRVIAVVPWFGYSRQDKKSAPREPISARLVARVIEAAGADRVLTMDLHAGRSRASSASRWTT